MRPKIASICFVLVQRPRTAQFPSEDYLLYVLLRDEKRAFFQSLISDVRRMFVQKSISVITGIIFLRGDQEIFTGWNRYFVELIKK